STLAMQPSVRVLCNDGAIITQGNAQNLTTLIDFTTNSANGASIERCTIDGNSSNNTNSLNNQLILGWDANDVTVRGNILRNSTGYGVLVRNGLRPTIVDNSVTNYYVSPIAVVASVASTASFAQIERNRITANGGANGIQVWDSDFALIRGNII